VITFTGVPPGSGERLGVDRDRDGCLDGDERSQQSDAAHPGTAVPDSDGDGLPDESDRCPGWFQEDHHQRDLNRDGLPDECQCGDVNDDGWLDWRDVFALRLHLKKRWLHGPIALEKCNVVGEAGNDPSLCTREDLAVLSQALPPGAPPWSRPQLEPRCLPEDPPPSPVAWTCVD
jgi:hypothetical protein